MSKQTTPNSSFEPLDLLSYLKSGPTTPFHILIDFIMPQFLDKLSHAKKHINFTETDFAVIQKQLINIENACETLKVWEDRANKEFKDLILHNLDDAFKERTQASRNFGETKILVGMLQGAWDLVVSMLENRISSIKEVPSNNSESSSFKPSRFAIKLQLNVKNMMAKSPIFKEIEEYYNGLSDESKNCLLCFSVFPQNAVIKKIALVYWWVGEEFLSKKENGNDLFKEFITQGIIEAVSKKRRKSSQLCRMHPLIRYAVILLAEKKRFIHFHSNGNPTTDFSKNKRGCLVTTEEGSSLRELTYGFCLKEENVETLFNVSEPYVDFREDSFSKMKKMRVLQLGRVDQGSDKQVVEVDDTEFLKGLKKMKDLRYFSLRGITGVTVLPDSICKLSNLIIVDLHGCHYLERLPEKIGSLKNLTWLDISGCHLISHMPFGLASLSKLQVLKGFLIGKPVCDARKFCTLANLANLGNLKKLSINVDGRSDVQQELNRLSDFKNLVSLSIAWLKNHKNDNGGSLPEKEDQKHQRSTQPGNSKKTTTECACLAKLDLQFLPYSEMPDWVKSLNLKNLKKLYVRGGNLSKLDPVGKVSSLRLESLSELHMYWGRLRALFPDLRYVRKLKCPKLVLFPCDENGEWVSGEPERKLMCS